jgi:hypothetical protein
MQRFLQGLVSVVLFENDPPQRFIHLDLDRVVSFFESRFAKALMSGNSGI